ncbi:hypothetical protein SAMN05444162_2499 [Paenibacillaceae bacterium GAS479]|nr:hypothetical protein SAMN05444162_2499 [Paenibacillaceae bacterium GAS479]
MGVESIKKWIKLSDRTEIEVGFSGDRHGKVVMLPVAKKPIYGSEAEALKQWGIDPEAGKSLTEGLADSFGIIAFDYEDHLFRHPKPEDLTPERIAEDFLRIADGMNVDCFSYYGYSWLALAGLQLAIRTDRLEALIMGGFPPYEGPYKEMLIVTEHTYKQALSNANTGSSTSKIETIENAGEEIDWNSITVTINPSVAKQFVTLYRNLADFDDRSVQNKLLQLPKLAFAGEQDTIVYGDNFGGVTVDIIGLLVKNKANLIERGWNVEILCEDAMNMDHTKAMQPAKVVPLIKRWLIEKLLSERKL